MMSLKDCALFFLALSTLMCSRAQSSDRVQPSIESGLVDVRVDLGSSLEATIEALGSPDQAFLTKGFDAEGTGLMAHGEPETLELQYAANGARFAEACPECPPLALNVFFGLRSNSDAELKAHPLGVVRRVWATPGRGSSAFLPAHAETLFGKEYIETRQPLEDPDCVDVCDSKQCFGEQGSLLWLYEATNVRVDWVEYKGAITHATGISVDDSNIRLQTCEKVKGLEN